MADEEAESTIISLATDVLFEPESLEVPEGAEATFTEIFEEVPDGAEVEVIGHTDSRPSRIGNDQLLRTGHRP